MFFVYLYQRRIYPVDKKRVNEFGRAYEDSDDDDKEGEAKKGEEATKGGDKDESSAAKEKGDKNASRAKKESKKRR